MHWGAEFLFVHHNHISKGMLWTGLFVRETVRTPAAREYRYITEAAVKHHSWSVAWRRWINSNTFARNIRLLLLICRRPAKLREQDEQRWNKRLAADTRLTNKGKAALSPESVQLLQTPGPEKTGTGLRALKGCWGLKQLCRPLLKLLRAEIWS